MVFHLHINCLNLHLEVKVNLPLFACVCACAENKCGIFSMRGSAASQWQYWSSCRNKEAMMKCNCSQTDFIITLAVSHRGALGFSGLHPHVW